MSNKQKYPDWGAYGTGTENVKPEPMQDAGPGTDNNTWDLTVTIGDTLIEIDPSDPPEHIKVAMQQAYQRVDAQARTRAEPDKKPKQSRINDRTEVIEAAIKEARTPDNPHSILEALRTLARERRYPQLIGYVPDEGFQWVTGPDERPRYQVDKDALASIKLRLKNKSA